jgi:16S rRNA (cytosine967-C5)-methyltransferase
MKAPRIPTSAMPKGVRTRMIAIECLRQIEEGGFVQPTLAQLGGGQLPQNDQRLLRETVMGVLRNQLWLDNLITPHVKGGLKRLDHGIVLALRIGVFQLTKLDRVPSHAAVSTTVEGYKRIYGRKAAGLVNGVLRSVLRTPAKAPEPLHSLKAVARRYSQPLWLLEKWHSILGLTQTIDLCEVLNSPAPLTIRPIVHQDRDWLSEVLGREDAETQAGEWTDYSLTLNHPMPFGSESFRDGLWTAQDEASQIVCELLDPQSQDTIWDVCAAPGGKTALIQWLTRGE